jgi:CheY-like chemotaxis protein
MRVQFTPAGQSITVVVRAPEPHPDSSESLVLHAAVRDSGIGMTPEELARLFERFGQMHRGISRDYGGSGLGLNISRGLVRLLGGELSVQSVKGEGTTFSFFVRVGLVPEHEKEMWLRKRQEEEEAERAKQKEKEMSSSDGLSISSTGSIGSLPSEVTCSTQELTDPPAPKFGHVLVVEDNSINQKVLATYLKKLGYANTVCSDGREAIELYKRHHYECIIMDIEMPIMDGREATRNIRQYEESLNPPIPGATIIALSGNARPGLLQEAYDTGLDDYLTKPCR